MSVVHEREHVPETLEQAQFWLIQRGFYRDIPESDRTDINSFLLQPELVAGISPVFFTDPTIAAIAEVAEAFHAGQKRKATPTHPYMKHVYMAAFQCGRLLPGGDLEEPMIRYYAQFGIADPPYIHVIGSALVHDALESNRLRSRDHLFEEMVANGVHRTTADEISRISQLMIPGDKPPHLPPEEYKAAKDSDLIRYYKPDILKRFGSRLGPGCRLVKGSDIFANGCETTDDVRKKREGDNLGDPTLFHANLETRWQVFARRLSILEHYDPLNPFIPDLRRLCQTELLNHAAGVEGVEDRRGQFFATD